MLLACGKLLMPSLAALYQVCTAFNRSIGTHQNFENKMLAFPIFNRFGKLTIGSKLKVVDQLKKIQFPDLSNCFDIFNDWSLLRCFNEIPLKFMQ